MSSRVLFFGDYLIGTSSIIFDVVFLIIGSISFSYVVLSFRIYACLFHCIGFLQLYSQEAKPSSEDFGAWIQRNVQWCWHGLVRWPVSISAREPWRVFYRWYDSSKYSVNFIFFYASFQSLYHNSKLHTSILETCCLQWCFYCVCII